MVERLKQAIERARRERDALGPGAGAAASAAPPGRRGGGWEDIPLGEVTPATLVGARVVTAAKTDLAHVPFDIMRTRILKICREKGWRRIGVTSATKHCGKTFVSVNLAFSMVRNPEIRCMLIDFDLRRPSLQRLLRLLPTTTFEHHLRGDARAIDVLLRVRPNLAVACSAPTAHSSELIQSPRTLDALAQMQTEFAPDVMIFDMPPALAGDDVLSTLGAMDALLVVAAAGTTTAQDIRDAEQMFSGAAGFLGVVLNKVDPADAETLAYDYATASVA